MERLGYTHVPDAPLGLQEIREALAPLYRAEAEANLSETLFGYLEDLAASGAATFAQADLVERWSISQPAVSGILSQLQRAGYIRVAGRRTGILLQGNPSRATPQFFRCCSTTE